jgi:DNA polymerase III subunit epsilon
MVMSDKPRMQQMPPMPQMGLDLGMEPLVEAPTPTPAAKAAKTAKTAKTVKSVQADAAAAANAGEAHATPMTLADMAQLLSADPDYRVIRRLQPSTHFDRAAVGPVKRVAVLDTETTGLSSATDVIIELALVVMDIDTLTGQPVGEVLVFDGFQDPGRPIPKEVQQLTGITDAMVKGQALDAAAISSIMDGVQWVVAHNAGFDRPFVEQRLSYFADLPWACSFADIPWKQHGIGSAKLEALAAHYGWFYDAHRADMDCHALAAVLGQPVGDTGQLGWQLLLGALDAPQYTLQATGAPFDAKDALKARGYRWDGVQRVWHTRVASEQGLRDECAWLGDHVYANPRAQVAVAEVNALARYSARTPQFVSHAVRAT